MLEASLDEERDSFAHQPLTINHLPPEVLGVIFELCLASSLIKHDPLRWGSCASDTPWGLSQVCSYWRQVAHGNSNLWIQSPKLQICGPGNDIQAGDLVQSLMSRTSSQKLYLTLKAMQIDRSIISTIRCRVLSTLVPHFHRIEELDLYVEDIASWNLIPTNAPLKSLKKLCLHIRNTGTPMCSGPAGLPSMFAFLPSLRWITIRVDQQPNITQSQPIVDRLPHVRWFQFMPLTRLELYRDRNLEGLEHMLSSASNLLELKLVDICCASWHTIPAIIHPRLRLLHISADPESETNFSCFQFAENLLTGATFVALKELEFCFEDCWFQLHILQYFLTRSRCYLRKCVYPSSNVANVYNDLSRLLTLLPDVNELTLGWIGANQLEMLIHLSDGPEPLLPRLRKFRIMCCSFDDRHVTKFIQVHDLDADRPLETLEIVVRETSKPIVIQQRWPFSMGSLPNFADDLGPLIRSLTAYKSGEALASDPTGITTLKALCKKLNELNIWPGPVQCYFNKNQEGYNLVLSLVQIALKLNRTKALGIEAARLRHKLNSRLRRITNDPFLFKILPPNWKREPSPDCPAFNRLIYRR
ncbi:hypothetical protein BJ165DRAFT_1480812 [Panaeolus papilionaceus]|nr:hypothetical protein BJ165DRAFT_1480812 [Panaeolus papilionaceus]